MAARIKWRGKDYGQQVTTLTLGEVILVEREIGIDAEHWSTVVRMAAEVFITVRKTDPDAITWADIEALPVEDLETCFILPAAKKAPADRKPKRQTAAERSAAMKASSDPLGGGGRASTRSRSTRATKRAAAGSTSSAAPST